jgi:glycosyltransferase involved in cell wall biosynthesis
MAARLSATVVISTYNRAEFLPEAIECLLDQTRVPDEIIVVDDGSTDNTPEVLAGYGNAIRVIRQHNQGVSAGRNVGIRAASNDLIAFLDSDDTLAPESIEKRMSVFAARNDCDVVYSDALWTVVANQSRRRWPGTRPTGDIFVHIARYNIMPIHCYMFRKECLEKSGLFDEHLRTNEDFDFFLRLAARCRFRYLDEPLAYYRFHDTMTSKTERTRLVEDTLEFMHRVYKMPAFDVLSARDKSVIYSSHGIKLMPKYPAEARRSFVRAIRAFPIGPRSYVLLGLSLPGQRVFGTLHGWYLKSRNYVPPPG